MEIQVEHLVKSFGRVKAVDDLSFTLHSGDIFGFIGPNGAGKTTTIKLMATLDVPDSGDVIVDGVSAVLYPEKVRPLVGYMPDALPDHSDIAVWEYLDFYARSFKLTAPFRLRRLKEVEEFTNLGELRHKPLNALSKGMKQRVSLARALLHDPGLLLMDEPAAGLDPRARIELRNMLKELAGQGKAILLSSHILTELQDICSGAVIIEKGKLLSAGSLEEISNSVRPAEEKNAAVTLQYSGNPDEIMTLLGTMPEVKNCRNKSNMILFEIDNSNGGVNKVMAALFAAGLPITGFSFGDTALEDLFMQITSGKVQ